MAIGRVTPISLDTFVAVFRMTNDGSFIKRFNSNWRKGFDPSLIKQMAMSI